MRGYCSRVCVLSKSTKISHVPTRACPRVRGGTATRIVDFRVNNMLYTGCPRPVDDGVYFQVQDGEYQLGLLCSVSLGQ